MYQRIARRGVITGRQTGLNACKLAENAATQPRRKPGPWDSWRRRLPRARYRFTQSGKIGVQFDVSWPCGQNAGRSPKAAESAFGADEGVEQRQTACTAGPARLDVRVARTSSSGPDRRPVSPAISPRCGLQGAFALPSPVSWPPETPRSLRCVRRPREMGGPGHVDSPVANSQPSDGHKRIRHCDIRSLSLTTSRAPPAARPASHAS
jgi:hypothetical protein